MVLVSDVDHNMIVVNKDEEIKCYFNKKYANDIQKDIDFIANENWYPVKKRIFDECKKYMKKEFNVDIEDKNISIRPLIYLEPVAKWKVPVRIKIFDSQEFNLMFAIYNGGIYETNIMVKKFL